MAFFAKPSALSVPKTHKFTRPNSFYAQKNKSSTTSTTSYHPMRYSYSPDTLKALEYQAHDPQDPHDNPRPGETLPFPNPGHGYSPVLTQGILWGTVIGTSLVTYAAIAWPLMNR